MIGRKNHSRDGRRVILFVCGHNAGRSQMAQAFFNTLKRDYPHVDAAYEAVSVGTRPGLELNSAVVKAMQEIGIDMHSISYFPKALSHELITSHAKRIVRAIVACDDTCVLPEGIDATIEHWNLPDPARQPLETIRSIREEVRQKVTTLLEELAAS